MNINKLKVALENINRPIFISFPEEEIPILKNQDKIITTRVSEEYNKYKTNDVVLTPWNELYKVSSTLKIDDVKEHPFYNELTNEQISIIKKYDGIEMVTLYRNSIANKKEPLELHNKMKNIEYGLYDIEHDRRITSKDKEFNNNDYLNKNCVVLKPDEVLDKQLGTCWDTSFCIYHKLKDYNIKEIYYYGCIELTYSNSHTCVIYKSIADNFYYWFEISFEAFNGITGPFLSYKDAAKYCAKKLEINHKHIYKSYSKYEIWRSLDNNLKYLLKIPRLTRDIFWNSIASDKSIRKLYNFN